MRGVTLNTEGVWTELHANIRAFVARRVRQPADVDDIVQRVFLQVHRGLPALRDADRIHAWIYQTTRRGIADYYRAPALRREIPAGGAVDFDAGFEAGDAAGEPDASAMSELSSCLRPLMMQLEPGDRQALELVELEGLTQVEAASRLGLSVSGMKSRVQRARRRLRAGLDDCCQVALDARGGVVSFEPRAGECGPCGKGDTNAT